MIKKLCLVTVLILSLLMPAAPAATAIEEERLTVQYGATSKVCQDLAIVQGDITYLPIRDVFAALENVELTWAKDEAEDKIIIVTPNGKYQLVINFTDGTAYGVEKTYRIKHVNHKIYLPVSFYAEVFDCGVSWDEPTDTLLIGREMALIEEAIETQENLAIEEAALPEATPVAVINLPTYEPTTVSRSLADTTLSVYQQGTASWYSDKFHGRRTSSGEAYNKNDYTAAHPSLPFGTIVRVTSLSNGKSVDVRINDRGPFVHGRVIDISRAAAAEIGLITQGVGAVQLSIVQ